MAQSLVNVTYCTQILSCTSVYTTASVAEYHQFFLNLSNSFPSHLHACSHHSFSRQQLTLFCWKAELRIHFEKNYMTSHWSSNNVQNTTQAFKAVEDHPLPSFVALSPGCRYFQAPSISTQHAALCLLYMLFLHW